MAWNRDEHQQRDDDEDEQDELGENVCYPFGHNDTLSILTI